MKKLTLLAVIGLSAVAMSAQAQYFGFAIGACGVSVGIGGAVGCAPVAAPVVYSPPPVAYMPPVAYAPAPVYYTPAPAYYAPAPVVYAAPAPYYAYGPRVVVAGGYRGWNGGYYGRGYYGYRGGYWHH
jgi:hypothetical protein